MSHPPLVFSSAPPQLLNLLTSHLPTTLTILRRIQSAAFPIGTSSNARIIFTSDTGSLGDDTTTEDGSSSSSSPKAFTVCWVDLSTGPDTQMWLYSTLEDKSITDVPETVYEKQLEVLVAELTRMNGEYDGKLVYPGSLLLGSLHSDVRAILERQGRVQARNSGFYDKWLFKDEDIPVGESILPEGMKWDRPNLDDCHEVVSNTTIPRRAELLIVMPSLVIKLDDGTLIAWAFLGFDGSLSSLFIKEPYRRRGLGKLLTAKLFREETRRYGSDGWSSADVSADNVQSRGMCKSLGGEPRSVVSWMLIDITEKS